MSSRLDRVNNWQLIAKESRYCALNLARMIRMPPRQLRRFFEARKWVTPHNWLRELRMQRALELICNKTPAKEVAIELGYKDAAHFTHDFKDYFGVPPSKLSSNQPDLPVRQKMSLFDK